MAMSKYRSRKVTLDGITFDSVRESRRYQELKLLERAGKIVDLKRQVKYRLLPSQKIGNKTVEREVSYIADFTYWQGNEFVVEDVKGVKTKDYILKRKMMLYFHGIRIREV